MNICETIYLKLGERPFTNHSFLLQHILKTCFSIPSNIAEGCSRTSIKDLCRFLEIALGSAFELETQIVLFSKVTQEDFDKELEELIEIQKMIGGFKQLKQNSIV